MMHDNTETCYFCLVIDLDKRAGAGMMESEEEGLDEGGLVTLNVSVSQMQQGFLPRMLPNLS